MICNITELNFTSSIYQLLDLTAFRDTIFQCVSNMYRDSFNSKALQSIKNTFKKTQRNETIAKKQKQIMT